MGDLIISGSNCHLDCDCSRWDVENYGFIIETWLTKSQLTDLRNSIRPGATKELYRILGKPNFYDTSWTGANSLIFTPNSNSGSNLYRMRRETLGYCRNITTSPLTGDKKWVFVKLEMYISGSAL